MSAALTPDTVAVGGLDVLIATYRDAAERHERDASALAATTLQRSADHAAGRAAAYRRVIADLELLRGRIHEVGS